MQCLNFYHQASLKAEDGEDDEVGQMDSLRRTPRIKAEGDVRKSRRFSTGVNPNRDSRGKNSASPKKCIAEEYSQRKNRLKE